MSVVESYFDLTDELGAMPDEAFVEAFVRVARGPGWDESTGRDLAIQVVAEWGSRASFGDGGFHEHHFPLGLEIDALADLAVRLRRKALANPRHRRRRVIDHVESAISEIVRANRIGVDQDGGTLEKVLEELHTFVQRQRREAR